MADAFPRSFRQRLLSLLSQSSHVSAPFISTFLLIHLCAPVVANVGGSSLSSQVMLLGREYYQTNFGEQYLVLGPLAVHALSGIVRRALITYIKIKSPSVTVQADGSSPKPSTIFQRICSALPSTTLSSSAYTALLILPIHFGIHRILPTTPNPPVLSLGPSELDYSFVQYGLQRWPARTWAMYLVLVVAVITHAIEGSRVLMGSLYPGPLAVSEPQATQKPSNNFVVPNNSKIYRRLLAVALTLPILSGLYVLYKEPLYLFSDMGRRFEGAYRLSWIYSSQ
ncbi:hypothetical protein F5890DRAFT_1553178 [Lentinula detonsa]|uniref:Mitochondrial adapter protein MCP1 transmembrane domain-containing protein n=1 Tax=Lentinula detonsa TaxID=2804962 RepID=A0AA38USS3_9AGAR|nr:hypothetical protein F5890DRAFT_1553178 [Lentinula detonsa]